MNLFDGPYPLDYLFLRIAGEDRIVFLPLCEAVAYVNNANYDQKLSNDKQVVFTENKKDSKMRSHKISCKDFVLKLQHDIYDDKYKIAAFIIQPQGEMQTPEVTQFLDHY